MPAMELRARFCQQRAEAKVGLKEADTGFVLCSCWLPLCGCVTQRLQIAPCR